MKIFKNVSLGKDPKLDSSCTIGFDDDSTISIGDNVLLRSNSVIYPDNTIGDNFSTGHNVVIRENNRIGVDVTVGTNSVVEGQCIIEDGVTIHSNCFVGEKTVIKRGAWIGPGVVIINTKYPKHKIQKWESPVVGERVIVGAGSIILPGVKIGDNAMIGAGSLVTKDVPPKKLAYGNPIVVVKDINDIEIDGREYER